MSVFDDQIAGSGLPMLAEPLGQTIIYEAPQADPVTLTALVGPEVTEEAPDGHGKTARQVRAVTVSVDAAADLGGVVSPNTHATVTIGGIKYAVESISHKSGGCAVLRLVRTGKTEVSRPGYRGYQ